MGGLQIRPCCLVALIALGGGCVWGQATHPAVGGVRINTEIGMKERRELAAGGIGRARTTRDDPDTGDRTKAADVAARPEPASAAST